MLDVGGWDDLSWKVEPLSEVVKTLWGKGVVVVLPAELGLEVASRGEGLASLQDLRVYQSQVRRVVDVCALT